MTDNPTQNLRSEYRLTGRIDLVLELEGVGPDESIKSRSIRAQTSDVSAHGVRITTAEAVPVGALLPAILILLKDKRSVQLVVEVVRCREKTKNVWEVGLKVVASDGTQYIDWIDAVARAMTAD